MNNSLRHSGTAATAATMASRPPVVSVPSPPGDNARILSDITVRAVSVDQTLDDVGRQLDELAKRIV